jgi:hypothetical protein
VGAGGVVARPLRPREGPARAAATSRAGHRATVACRLLKAACEAHPRRAGPQAFAALRCYPDSLPAAQRTLFEGVWTSELPDLERLVLNVQKAHPGAMGRALAHELVEGYLAFALFEARNSLPPSKAGELSRDVAKCLKGK